MDNETEEWVKLLKEELRQTREKLQCVDLRLREIQTSLEELMKKAKGSQW